MKLLNSKFKKVFAIYLVILLCLSIGILIYVKSILIKYEASQPENELEQKIDILSDEAKKGSIESLLSFTENPYDFSQFDNTMLEKYLGSLANDKLTYELKVGSYSSTTITYHVKSGDSILADITLENDGTSTKLAFFTVTNWHILSVVPYVYKYSVILPNSLTLSVNDVKLEGSLSDDKVNRTYNFNYLCKPEIIISDVLGNTVDYSQVDKIMLTDYVISVPTNFVLKNGDAVIPSSISVYEKNPAYQYVNDSNIAFPGKAVYSLSLLKDKLDLKIIDNIGNNLEYEMVDNCVTIDSPSALSEVPADVLASVNVLDIAEKWSLFMTDDLSGSNSGFSTISQYLIKDSYLYKVAWNWVTGPDIGMTSNHTLRADPFDNESVSNYIRYSEECFSCDITFVKYMTLKSGSNVTDTMNSTFYFVHMDNTDDGVNNPVWLLADIYKIVD